MYLVAMRQQLQLAGRTLEPGEEVHAIVAVAPNPPTARQQIEQQQPAPVAWKPSGGGEWQASCLSCRPFCPMANQPLLRDPAQLLAEAKKRGDIAARMGLSSDEQVRTSLLTTPWHLLLTTPWHLPSHHPIGATRRRISSSSRPSCRR